MIATAVMREGQRHLRLVVALPQAALLVVLGGARAAGDLARRAIGVGAAAAGAVVLSIGVTLGFVSSPARDARRALRLATTLAALAALALLVALGIAPRFAGYRTMTVLGASMEPTIPQGSIVFVTPLPAEQVAVGQIITYEVPVGDHQVVSHRVVEVVERGPDPVVRTKGDANEAIDPWTVKLQGPTVWRVRRWIPAVGHGIAALRHPIARRITVLGVPALLAVLWVREIWRRPRRTVATVGGHG